MKTNQTLRQEGMSALKERWGKAAILFLVYMIIAGVVSAIPKVGCVISLFVISPIAYGLGKAFLDNLRDNTSEDALEVSNLFVAFKGEESQRKYWDVTGTMLLAGIYALLWSLLFVIPGIIKSYAYSLTPLIMRDEPELSFNAAIEKSMAMMKGYKLKLFLLTLNFIMWITLSLLTLGIGLLWVGPYMWSTFTAFYEDVKADYNKSIE